MKTTSTIKIVLFTVSMILGLGLSGVFGKNPENENNFVRQEKLPDLFQGNCAETERIMIFDLNGNMLIDNMDMQTDEETHNARLNHLLLRSVVLTEFGGTTLFILDAF